MRIRELRESKHHIELRLNVLRNMKGDNLEERTVIRELIREWETKLIEKIKVDVIERFLNTEVTEEIN